MQKRSKSERGYNGSERKWSQSDIISMRKKKERDNNQDISPFVGFTNGHILDDK